LAVGEDDVHHSKQQQIGHFAAIGHELGDPRFAYAETLG
jgi:hypothetical protein